MTIYAHAPEHHIQNRSETENAETGEKFAPAETETTSTAESAESSTPLCDTFSSDAKTDGSSEHTSCPAAPSMATNSAKAYLPVGESLFGLVIVTPFLLHFLKRKF